MHPITGTACPARNAYSWPGTSTGSNLDALQAGWKPKKFPATASRQIRQPTPWRRKVPKPAELQKANLNRSAPKICRDCL